MECPDGHGRMDAISDDELVRLYREGDLDAFDALFDRYHDPVYRFARTLLGNADGAQEVLQEAFLALARGAEAYQPRGRFRAWLMRIVRNRCLNRIETLRASRRALAESGFDPADLASANPLPTQRAETDERLAAIRRAVAELPERQREALALHAFEQLGYREIAEVLGMPINTVKTLIHRARANVAGSLASRSQEPDDGL